MKRSTKRVVGWGTGVSIGVVLILVAVVLVIAGSSTPPTLLEDTQSVAQTAVDSQLDDKSVVKTEEGVAIKSSAE